MDESMGKREKQDDCGESEMPEAVKGPCRASLHGRMAHVARVLAQRQQKVLAEHEMDLRAYATLAKLEHAPCSSQLDLAKQSQVDKSTLVAILDGLEKAGWVERVPDAQDRRARIVHATAAGKNKLAAVHQCVRAVEDDLLSALTAEDRQAFLASLAKLSETET